MQIVQGSVEVLEDLLVRAIQELTEGTQTLALLLPGGSNIPIAVGALSKLDNSTRSQLHITLSDERFGPVGHPGSNYQQYSNAGVLDLGLDFTPVLSGKSIDETTQEYNASLKKLFRSNDHMLAFLGMGSDGHIAGILPTSPAITSQELATNYDGVDYSRITATFKALERADSIIVGAFGDSKREAIITLDKETTSSEIQPAQELKRYNHVTIVTDQTGES